VKAPRGDSSKQSEARPSCAPCRLGRATRPLAVASGSDHPKGRRAALNWAAVRSFPLPQPRGRPFAIDFAANLTRANVRWRALIIDRIWSRRRACCHRGCALLRGSYLRPPPKRFPRTRPGHACHRNAFLRAERVATGGRAWRPR
jgi:hypothetical protein